MADADHKKSASSVLLDAMLAAARKLQIEGIFLRTVAAELPSNPWLSNMRCSENDSLMTVQTIHHCPPDCALTPTKCLTALKVEEVVSTQKRRPYTIESVQVTGTEIEIRLYPFS
jgi:hypothetical protein